MIHSNRSWARRALLPAASAVVLVAALAAPAAAHPSHSRFAEVDLVSDQQLPGVLQDPNLVNAWGLALSPTSPLWVANNGTNTATIYAGGVNGAPVTKVPLTVSVPGGAPTGQAFNDTTAFQVTGSGGMAPATFLFVSEGGDITGWNRTATPTGAVLARHIPGAIYKGLAIVHTKFGPFLIAADFHNGRLDVFDGSFNPVHLPGVFFHDPRLPRGYAPFNVFALGDALYVSYAKQDADQEDEIAGAGFGFVDKYTNFGLRVQRIASRGPLNAPWGMAVAPAAFGDFAGALLVGNFGDGRISAYRGDHFVGQLRTGAGKPITIDGLWGLLPGTATAGGTGAVWFSAGPDDESHGLVGEILPAM
jgi:uncharacterized protein (TIGR03118 family)